MPSKGDGQKIKHRPIQAATVIKKWIKCNITVTDGSQLGNQKVVKGS